MLDDGVPLSVLVTNVYPGDPHVAQLLENLAEQTYRNFELILVDSYYRTNVDLVMVKAHLLNLDVIHTPAMEARHVGRKFHWELYSNALLLSRHDWFYQHGVFRRLHRDALRVIAEHAAKGVAVVLHQTQVISAQDTAWMHCDAQPWPYLSNSGFFSFPRFSMIYDLNGHNEALTMQHWVDVDLTARSQHLRDQPCVTMHNALARLQKVGYDKMRVGKPSCLGECVTRQIVHDGASWLRCDQCGSLSVLYPEDYCRRLVINGVVKAPINVAGVGRNLAALDEELQGRTLADKVYIIERSHDDERYLSP